MKLKTPRDILPLAHTNELLTYNPRFFASKIKISEYIKLVGVEGSLPWNRPNARQRL